MPVLTVRFINTTGFISRLITGATFSLMDHVEVMNRARNGWVGAHAGTGVQDRPLNWADKNLIWVRQYDIPSTDAEYERGMAALEASVGTPYNYRGVLGVFLRLRGFTSAGRVDCSQNVENVLCAAKGVPPLNVLPQFSWMVTPEILHLASIFIGRMDHSASVG